LVPLPLSVWPRCGTAGDGKAEIGDITGHSSRQTSQDTPLGRHHGTLLGADITGHSIYFLDLEKKENR